MKKGFRSSLEKDIRPGARMSVIALPFMERCKDQNGFVSTCGISDLLTMQCDIWRDKNMHRNSKVKTKKQRRGFWKGSAGQNSDVLHWPLPRRDKVASQLLRGRKKVNIETSAGISLFFGTHDKQPCLSILSHQRYRFQNNILTTRQQWLLRTVKGNFHAFNHRRSPTIPIVNTRSRSMQQDAVPTMHA